MERGYQYNGTDVFQRGDGELIFDRPLRQIGQDGLKLHAKRVKLSPA